MLSFPASSFPLHWVQKLHDHFFLLFFFSLLDLFPLHFTSSFVASIQPPPVSFLLFLLPIRFLFSWCSVKSSFVSASFFFSLLAYYLTECRLFFKHAAFFAVNLLSGETFSSELFHLCNSSHAIKYFHKFQHFILYSLIIYY